MPFLPTRVGKNSLAHGVDTAPPSDYDRLMTITQNTKPAPLTADAYADLWSQMLRWEAAEATAEAGDEHPFPEDDPYWYEDDEEPSYGVEWDEDEYGIVNYRVTTTY